LSRSSCQPPNLYPPRCGSRARASPPSSWRRRTAPNAREQFSEAERLGHIVVRAQLEAHDTIDFLQPVTGGDDHGDVRVGSNLSEQIEPIFAPKSQIENDQARLTHGEMASQVLPAGRGTRRDVMLFEVTGDHPPRGRIVIDNEYVVIFAIVVGVQSAIHQ